MLRRSPPLSAIEAFLAAAKAPTFKDAALSLVLSPSAFSRRIQALEQFVERAAFDRSGPSPTLNGTGARYREAIEDPVGGDRPRHRGVEGRISRFARFGVSVSRYRMARAAADEAAGAERHRNQAGAIGRNDRASQGRSGFRHRRRARRADGFPSERLAALDGVVVSPPILCDGRAPPNTLDDISDYERLDVTTPTGVWRHWFTVIGRPTPDGRSSRPFDSLHLMYKSAAAGLGVALAVPMASERFLVDGRLRPCLPDRASVGASYELASRAPELARRSTVKRLKTWLFEEAAASMRLFDERCALPSHARGRRSRDPGFDPVGRTRGESAPGSRLAALPPPSPASGEGATRSRSSSVGRAWPWPKSASARRPRGSRRSSPGRWRSPSEKERA